MEAHPVDPLIAQIAHANELFLSEASGTVGVSTGGDLIPDLYAALPTLVETHTFSDAVNTPIASARHGDLALRKWPILVFKSNDPAVQRGLPGKWTAGKIRVRLIRAPVGWLRAQKRRRSCV